MSKVSEQKSIMPLAIVGIGCRFPSVANPDQFWKLLDDGTDAISEVPPDRFDVNAVYDQNPDTIGRTHSRWGGFISELDGFDAEFFGISPREAAFMDPQQRQLLEVGWNALTDAGIAPSTIAGRNAGVYMGLIATNYWDMQDQASPNIYSVTGTSRAVLAGRLSYALDARGPSMSIDTACSSSLVAVHLACQSLRTGESDIALAGGVNSVLIPTEAIAYSTARMLSTHGRCKFGDSTGDGFVRSDGVGVVVLKRLSSATADGDRIYATILGTATNSDGQGSGYLLTPSEQGQIDLIRTALRQSGLTPADLDYVEAHGTGTRVGDAVELRALASVFRGERTNHPKCMVGSVKSNFGHTEGAAGVAGMIKTALSLYHNKVTASLHFNDPNPAIDWSDAPMTIPTTGTPWPGRTDAQPVAGVSSFGIGGTNAHVILQQCVPSPCPETAAITVAQFLLPISGNSPQALVTLTQAYASLLEQATAEDARKLVRAAAVRRDHYAYRFAATGTSVSDLRDELRSLAKRSADEIAADGDRGTPNVVFVFPGQGSQWMGMGRELLTECETFRRTMEACDEAVTAETGWSVLDVLDHNSDDWMAAADTVQPVLWAMEVSLAALWRSWGIEPNAVIGHSMGEVAAAYVAGSLSLRDSARIICRRSRLATAECNTGAMAVVELAADELEQHLTEFGGNTVVIAAYNSPNQCVVSGDHDAVQTFVDALDADSVNAQMIRVDFASHSPQMDRIRSELVSQLSEITPVDTQVRFYSTVIGADIHGGELDAQYWADNIRKPVRFAEGICQLAEPLNTVFIEISPHPVLTGAIKSCIADLEGQPTALFSTLRNTHELESLWSQLAELYVIGGAVDWNRVYPGGTSHVALPQYPWQHTSYNLPDDSQISPCREAAASLGNRLDRGNQHPLLGERVTLFDGASWERDISLYTHRYLLDHRVDGVSVLPATAYLELVHAAALGTWGARPIELQNIEFRAGLVLNAAVSPRLKVTFTGEGGNCSFTVTSSADHGHSWVEHAVGNARPVSAHDSVLDITAVLARCPVRLGGDEFYSAAAERGNDWTGEFRRITDVQVGERELVAYIDLPRDNDLYAFHPAALDACCHTLSGLVRQLAVTRSGAFLGARIDSIVFFEQPTTQLRSWARLAPAGPRQIRGDIDIISANGRVIARLVGVTSTFFCAPEESGVSDTWDAPFLEMAWRQLDQRSASPAFDASESWLLISEPSDLFSSLRARLGDTDAVHLSSTDGSRERQSAITSAMDRCRGKSPNIVLIAPTPDADGGDEIERGERLCEDLIRIVRSGGDFRLSVLTSDCQSVLAGDHMSNPGASAIWGMVRSLLLESPGVECKVIDAPESPKEHDLDAVLDELRSRTGLSQIAIRGGRRYGPSLHPLPDQIETKEEVFTPAVCSVGRPRQLGANAVDVAITTVVTTSPLFCGFTGTVVAIGRGVVGIQPGQNVFGYHELGMDGLETPSLLRMDAGQIVAVPPNGDGREFANATATYLAPHFAISHILQIRSDDRVLVISEAPDEDLLAVATVRLLRTTSATTFCIAKNPDVRTQAQLAGAIICDPRSPNAVDSVYRITRGQGANVAIVTTGVGELDADILAPDARILTLSGPLRDRPMPQYSPRSQQILDPVSVMRRDPRLAQVMLFEVADLVTTGNATPLMVATSETSSPPPGHTAPPADRKKKSVFSSNATYLVTGGLGDLGRVLIDWMISCGAQRIVAIGRTPEPIGSSIDPAGRWADLRRWNEAGADVEYHCLDIGDATAMDDLSSRLASDTTRPLLGVLHLAGVATEAPLSNTSEDLLHEALRPKLRGGWNLHRTIGQLPLDFFVCYSSASAVMSSPMLGAYAAANAALDGLVDYRTKRGLPALGIGWGFWQRVGMDARRADELGRSRTPVGIRGFTPERGCQILGHLLLTRMQGNVTVMPANWKLWADTYPAAAALPMMAELSVQPPNVYTSNGTNIPATAPAQHAPNGPMTASSSNAEQLLRNGSQNTTAALRKLVAAIMKLPESRIPQHKPLNKVGMDSLMATELRNRAKSELDLAIPIMAILGGATLEQLHQTAMSATATP